MQFSYVELLSLHTMMNTMLKTLYPKKDNASNDKAFLLIMN